MLHTRPKILVVDDTKTNIEVLEGILSKDYDIFVALNGRKAIELVQKIKPDLVLLDVMMPEMDGYETLRQIKKMPESEDLPVIFLTAKSDSSSEEEGLSLGAVDYITKPFHMEELVARVNIQLRKTETQSDEIIFSDLKLNNATPFTFSKVLKYKS